MGAAITFIDVTDMFRLVSGNHLEINLVGRVMIIFVCLFFCHENTLLSLKKTVGSLQSSSRHSEHIIC